MRNAECGIKKEGSVTVTDLKARTKRYALRVIRLTESLPKRRPAEVIGRQLLRSATSVGANYRAACRSRSVADFVAKMTLVEEEADESNYWLELLVEAKLVEEKRLEPLMKETNEIVAIAVSSIKTARKRLLTRHVECGTRSADSETYLSD
jgi:four helix bundle protein